MSLIYSDLTNFKGIVQIAEKEMGFNRGDISGDVNKLKEFTADVNLAMDDFFTIALKASGTWQFDDSNHTKYPFILINLASGQRDYSFTVDEQGNLILDIYKVMVADSSGFYKEINPVDQQSANTIDTNLNSFIDGRNTAGIPTRYDKTANGIFLDPVPNYNATNGLKVFINREGSYFVYTDTTKTPGVPGLFHRYFVIKPSFDYARRNNLTIAPRLADEVLQFEGDESKGIVGSIERYFGRRERDIKRILKANVENTR